MFKNPPQRKKKLLYNYVPPREPSVRTGKFLLNLWPTMRRREL